MFLVLSSSFSLSLSLLLYCSRSLARISIGWHAVARLIFVIAASAAFSDKIPTMEYRMPFVCFRAHLVRLTLRQFPIASHFSTLILFSRICSRKFDCFIIKTRCGNNDDIEQSSKYISLWKTEGCTIPLSNCQLSIWRWQQTRSWQYWLACHVDKNDIKYNVSPELLSTVLRSSHQTTIYNIVMSAQRPQNHYANYAK